MANLNILISGSGVAGAVFANCLLRAYRNVNITIVEKAPSLRLTGASVDIRSSAVDIIKWMGVEPEIRKHTTNEAGVQWVTSTGAPIGTIGATGRSDVQSITSEYEIFRGALANIFMTPVAPRVKLLFDEHVDTYTQDPSGVTVTFANSGETRRYDLLVAADGLGSRIRGAMLDAPPRDQIHDEGVHAAYLTIKRDLLHSSRLAKWYNAPGGRVVFSARTRTPQAAPAGTYCPSQRPPTSRRRRSSTGRCARGTPLTWTSWRSSSATPGGSRPRC